MNAKRERRYLEKLLKMIDSDKPHPLTSPWAVFIGWIMMFISMIMVSKLFGNGKNDLVLSFSSLMIGGAVGILFIFREAYLRWPNVKQHYDKTSIERRLAELEELPGVFK